MARKYRPRDLAARTEKWLRAGFPLALVESLKGALSEDERESEARARAFQKTGALVGTVRVVQPRATQAAKTGVIRAALAAGSRSQGNPVEYASVLQRGVVGYPGKAATRPHLIVAQSAGKWIARFRRGRWSGVQGSGKMLSFTVGGERFARGAVRHPGSRFKAKNYLQVNRPRVVTNLEGGLERSFKVEIG